METEPPHILVVDDDTRLRKLLQKFLMEHGYRVTLAASAAEARARMEGLAFDLTVLDVMMPGESGLTLTQFLRARSEMPVLLLSARSETDCAHCRTGSGCGRLSGQAVRAERAAAAHPGLIAPRGGSAGIAHCARSGWANGKPIWNAAICAMAIC